MLKVKTKKILFVIFLFAVLIRGIFHLSYAIELFPDAKYYQLLGNYFLATGNIDSYKVMPLYPILCGIKGWLGIGIFLDILISASSSIVIYLLSIELFKSNKAAIFASFVWALYPFSIYYSISGLTESTFTFLLLLCFILLYKKEFWWAMIVAVLSILVRPTLDYLMPVLLLFFGFFIHKMGVRHTLLLLPKYIIIYCIMMFPWWIHNWNQYDAFVRLNLGDGVMWYDGNNALNKTGSGTIGNMDHSQFKNIDDPVIRNAAMKKEAFQWIRANPEQFLNLVGLRLKRFWNIFPNAGAYKKRHYKLLSLFSFLPIILGSIIFLIRINRQLLIKVAPILLLILYLTFVHSLTIGSIRYRFPLEGFMIIFTSFTIVELLKSSGFLNEA